MEKIDIKKFSEGLLRKTELREGAKHFMSMINGNPQTHAANPNHLRIRPNPHRPRVAHRGGGDSGRDAGDGLGHYQGRETGQPCSLSTSAAR